MTESSTEAATQSKAASLDTLLREWDGDEVIIRFDRTSGAWIIIAIHSTEKGAAGGGTRMKSYPDLAAAVADAMRLSAAMTAKFAVAGYEWGGGKAVIAVPPDLDTATRQELLRRYGSLIGQLSGLFHTAPDVGTSPADMDIIAETGAPNVSGLTPDAGGTGDSGVPTALGVFHAIRAVATRLYGSDSLAGKTVLVQGAGNVGRALVAHLIDAGAAVLVSDVNREAVHAVQRQHHVGDIDPDAVVETECDIFSPCALGGVLSGATIPRLRCRGIAGAANNQLETDEDAALLKARGILYAPDFVANVGAVMAILGMEVAGLSEEDVKRRIAETVPRTLGEIFDLAESEDITTVAAANRIVEARRKRHTYNGE